MLKGNMLKCIVRAKRNPFNDFQSPFRQGQVVAKFKADDFDDYEKRVDSIREMLRDEFPILPYVFAYAEAI